MLLEGILRNFTVIHDNVNQSRIIKRFSSILICFNYINTHDNDKMATNGWIQAINCVINDYSNPETKIHNELSKYCTQGLHRIMDE